MINLISQGKIIRQFWDKIIRHSTDSISENKARVKQKEQYNYENGSIN